MYYLRELQQHVWEAPEARVYPTDLSEPISMLKDCSQMPPDSSASQSQQ
jgi:hypothetical protein